MESIGNGKRFTFGSQLEATGNNAIPNVFTTFNITNFPGLVFSEDNDLLFDFDEVTGIFTFKRTGRLQILATLNFDATGISEVQISPSFKRGAGAWTYLNARRTELPLTGPNDAFISGSIDVIKSDQLKFDVAASNLLASFKTEVLSNGSVIRAVVIDFLLAIR